MLVWVEAEVELISVEFVEGGVVGLLLVEAMAAVVDFASAAALLIQKTELVAQTR